MTGAPGVTECTEVLQPEPAVALARLLGVDLPDLRAEGLPLLWHWVYLLERPSQSDLGHDGHPVRGVIPAPPEPGRRRMAAGGRVRLLGPLHLGRETVRRSEVASSTDKEGRTGRLTFVVVRHTISQGGDVKVAEEQHVVYRDAMAAVVPVENPSSPPRAVTDRVWSLTIDPTVLFRFSALTYNAHRVHYDRDYARDVEGYPGLLTHGPLQALAMAESVRRARRTASAIDYRVVSPLFEHQGLLIRSEESASATDVSVLDFSGRVTATGRVETTGGQGAQDA